MKGLIIFLIPPQEVISGGIMSIFSLANESRKFKYLHHSEVFIAVYPGTTSYRKNNLFNNNEKIYEFDQLLAKNKDIDNLLIHIPEYEIQDILPSLNERINQLPANVHINILNQNIEHMPSPEIITELFCITSNVTQTVAHQRYATQEIANTYSIPTHLLTVYLDEEQYTQKHFSEKEKIILYSPDNNPDKEKVLDILKDGLPEYKLREINGITYPEYKRLISRAAYTITFGEGFDGYLIEPAFSGSIPIAVYNDTFFPSNKYSDFPNIFSSYEILKKDIVSFVKKLNSTQYNQLNSTLSKELKKTYSRPVYLKNIELFYEKKYTFTPSYVSILSAFTETAKRHSKRLIELEKKLIKNESEIMIIKTNLENRILELNNIKQSKSWKLIIKLKQLIHPGI